MLIKELTQLRRDPKLLPILIVVAIGGILLWRRNRKAAT
jgi:hypothetical protein